MTQDDLEEKGYRFIVMHGQGVTVQITGGTPCLGGTLSRFTVGICTTSNRHDSMQLALEKAMLHFVETRLAYDPI
jgi:hypothetical protein